MRVFGAVALIMFWVVVCAGVYSFGALRKFFDDFFEDLKNE